MIAPLDVCPSWERRLPLKTFARHGKDVCPSVVCPSRVFTRQSFARHGKDVCPSRRLPVGRLPVWTFARQSFARHVKDFPCKLFT